MMNLEPTTLDFNQMQKIDSASDNLLFNTFQTSDLANYITTTSGDGMTIRDITNDDIIILDQP